MAKIGGTLLFNPDRTKVLLLKRDNGNWDLPKGHVEPGESVIDGAKRETREETGLSPRILGKFDDEDHGDDNIKIYVALADHEDVTLSHEHVDFRWTTLQQAVETLYPPLARIVSRLSTSALDESTMSSLEERREENPDGSLSCGVFIPLPYDIAKDFPDKADKDDSVPHLTVLYAGKLSPSDYHKFCEVVGHITRSASPFDMDLAAYGEFTNEDGERIPHMMPSLCNRHKLSVLHGVLRRAVEAEGIKCDHSYGKEAGAFKGLPYEVRFTPHATLAYKAKDAVAYRGPRPTGAWKVNELECWGYEKLRFQLGRNAYDQPIGLARSPLGHGYKYPSAVKEDSIPGGLADNSKPSDFDPKQLAMGTRVELEHSKNLKIAREIAMDHLKEDPAYYTKLKKIEPHHESETSLKGSERHADPGGMGSSSSLGGALGLKSNPRYQDWLDDVLAGKTKKPFRAQ